MTLQKPTIEQLQADGKLHWQVTSTLAEWDWGGFRWVVSTHEAEPSVTLQADTIQMEYRADGDFWQAADDASWFRAMDVWDHYDDYIQPEELSDFVKAAMGRGNVVTF